MNNFIQGEQTYVYLMYLPYRNLVLQVEGFCMNHHNLETCEKAVSLMETMHAKYQRDQRRDYKLIGEEIRDAFEGEGLD